MWTLMRFDQVIWEATFQAHLANKDMQANPANMHDMAKACEYLRPTSMPEEVKAGRSKSTKPL